MPPSGEFQATATADVLGSWPRPRRGARKWAERAIIVAALAVYAGLLGLAWQAGYRLLPDSLTLRVAGHALHVSNIHDRIAGNALVMFFLLPTALWLECLFVGWDGSSLRSLFRPTASIRTDIAFFLLGQAHMMDIVGKLMMLGASMISGLLLRDWLRATFGFEISVAFLPLALQIGLYFLVYTFFDYWTHRVDHTRYFWPLHRYHHAAHDFCVINATREHPAAFVSIFLNVVTAALGFIIHSRIDSGFGWIGRYLIQSPNHHRLHHKLDMSHPTGHYSIAPVWDHLFGTWYGDADQSLVIGVDTPYRHGFWVGRDLVRDYWDFWRGFFRRHAG
jgi:sterol desaturase/sphingolipid hydroxylase (fatty acid hydroxylase superfamily)